MMDMLLQVLEDVCKSMTSVTTQEGKISIGAMLLDVTLTDPQRLWLVLHAISAVILFCWSISRRRCYDVGAD